MPEKTAGRRGAILSSFVGQVGDNGSHASGVLELVPFKTRRRRAYCIKIEERKYDSCGREYTPNARRKTNIMGTVRGAADEPGGNSVGFEGTEAQVLLRMI